MRLGDPALTTSYGYRPPRGARAVGWLCPSCSQCGEEPPRRWPHLCPACGGAVDPIFDEPWRHDADGYQLRSRCRSTNTSERTLAEADVPRWEYEDAVRAGNPTAITKAQSAFHGAVRRFGGQERSWALVSPRIRVVATARNAGDLEFAAEVIRAWYPSIDTRDLDDDDADAVSARRYEARVFVEACITFLEARDSIGHHREGEVTRAMRDIAARAESVLTGSQDLGMQRVLHLRASVSERARFAALGHSPITRVPARDSPVGRLLKALRPGRADNADAGGPAWPREARAWQKAVRSSRNSPIGEQTRVATAWVAWALGTDEADLVADAYEHLIPLIPRAVAARHGTSNPDELLRAAQEHVEEAGYWLCRAGRYRAAVLALETGRAVALSVANNPSPPLVEYGDVVPGNDDGAVVYVAAAKAGGYGLVVAGRHDPQYVELPHYDRASIATLLEGMLPTPAAQDRWGDPRDVHVESAAEVDATWNRGLAWLWRKGLDAIMLAYAHGRMVTLIPVGLLSLLPLHAAGVSHDRHAGMFSAVRYAPNARTLSRCRKIAAAFGPFSLLVADVPAGYGLPPHTHLACVNHETTAVADIWADAEREQRLEHSCRWVDFRRHAGDYDVWHIASHGGMRLPAADGGSALYFADAEVGIEQLRAAIRVAPRRLAILSACDSHLTSASLPNEAIGLPSALLELGFAGVIATTWKIDDAATPYLMAYFHRVWCSGDAHPAVALNRAQRWLARATRAELVALLPTMGGIAATGERPFADPRYWAGFAYTGA